MTILAPYEQYQPSEHPGLKTGAASAAMQLFDLQNDPGEQRDVAHAVWNEQRLRMRYESWTEVAEREIEPLGLVLKAGAWYVVGRRGRVARTF